MSVPLQQQQTVPQSQQGTQSLPQAYDNVSSQITSSRSNYDPSSSGRASQQMYMPNQTMQQPTNSQESTTMSQAYNQLQSQPGMMNSSYNQTVYSQQSNKYQQQQQQQQQQPSQYTDNQYQNQEQDQDQEPQEEEEDETGGGDKDAEQALQKEYANNVCHNLDPCDMIVSIICPCMTYAGVIQNLEPIPSENSMWSTGCCIWTGILAASAAAIEIPLLVPGACSWLPPLYFADVFDARQLLLAFAYFVPHCICHLPFRSSLLGNTENVCTTCAHTVLCSCCSLGSLKSLTKEMNKSYSEQETNLSKIMPFAPALYPKATLMQPPMPTNQMNEQAKDTRRLPPRTASRFEPRVLHYYYD